MKCVSNFISIYHNIRIEIKKNNTLYTFNDSALITTLTKGLIFRDIQIYFSQDSNYKKSFPSDLCI